MIMQKLYKITFSQYSFGNGVLFKVRY